MTDGAPSQATHKHKRSAVLNYSLRPAKNIERKMMAEAFARLARLAPLSEYRYVGLGSEFFNDFALYHEALGLQDMISIERDPTRLERCQFNTPYKCIRVVPGTSTEVLPKLGWDPRSIVWLDYVDKLDRSILEDIKLVAPVVRSGSMLVWSVNAHPWDEGWDEEQGQHIPKEKLPQHRLKKLRDSVAPRLVPDEWIKEPLAKWGLASVYYRFIVAEVQASLNDHNASAKEADKLGFHQCFHFRYADGQRMLTVGGLILNKSDSDLMGPDPFAGLPFIRSSSEPMDIKPPTLTGREVRFLNRLLPHENAESERPKWLPKEDLDSFRDVYRYYPVFAESEL